MVGFIYITKRQGDLAISQGFFFTKLRICEVSRKLNPRENFRIYSNAHSITETAAFHTWVKKECIENHYFKSSEIICFRSIPNSNFEPETV